MLFNKIISKKISSWINVLKKTPWKVVLANIIKKKDYYLSKINKILMVFNKKNLKLIFN
jgi:hypothetical protein